VNIIREGERFLICAVSRKAKQFALEFLTLAQ